MIVSLNKLVSLRGRSYCPQYRSSGNGNYALVELTTGYTTADIMLEIGSTSAAVE